MKKVQEEKPQRNLLLLEFSVLSFVAFVIIGYTVISAVRPALEGFILKKEEGTTVVEVNRHANKLLLKEDFRSPITPEKSVRFDQFITSVNISGMVRFFLTDSKGMVIYSSPRDYIATSLAGNIDVKRALGRRLAVARFQKIVPEEQGVLGISEAFVQVAPITFGASEEILGAAYIVSRVGLISKQIEETEAAMTVRIVGGLLFLYASLFVIVWRASKTIRAQAAELASYAKTLKQRVLERTRELKESMERQIAQAKELSRLKDEFVFIAAHELKAPITHLRWTLSEFFSEKEIQEKTPPEVHKLMQVIQKASDALVKLVTDLLNVARLESGTVTVSVHPTDLIAIAHDVTLQFKSEAEKQSVALTFDYDKSKKIPFAMGDSERLKEVFLNLISNAIKYNKLQGRVEVSVKEQDAYLEARVKDTGSGMSEDDLKHLFTKFWRAAEHRNIEGTGLGLWITKQLVERMGGKIWAESEKGVGSTFFVRLSIAKERNIKEMPSA